MSDSQTPEAVGVSDKESLSKFLAGILIAFGISFGALLAIVREPVELKRPVGVALIPPFEEVEAVQLQEHTPFAVARDLETERTVTGVSPGDELLAPSPAHSEETAAIDPVIEPEIPSEPNFQFEEETELSEPQLAVRPVAEPPENQWGQDRFTALIPANTVDRFRASMSRHGFDLKAVRAGDLAVPRILANAIPVDFAAVEQTPDKKRDFIRMMLPMILVTNEEITQNRKRVLTLRDLPLEEQPFADRMWLLDQFADYGVEVGDFDTLLARLDEVPPSLALAQAAIESGWGSSRFAREGNALFGQWTTEDYHGIVPAAREEGKTHKIRAFETPADSVASYIHNLNTHSAYRAFRAKRTNMREAGAAFNSMQLSETLISYSEKGMEYVDLLKSVIRVNGLREFDEVELAPAHPVLASNA